MSENIVNEVIHDIALSPVASTYAAMEVSTYQIPEIIVTCHLLVATGSYTIQGRRVRVYQPEFEECWASGLVSQHDPISHIMEITLDKVNNA